MTVEKIMVEDILFPFGVIVGGIIIGLAMRVLDALDKNIKSRRAAILKMFKNKDDAEFMRAYWEYD